jgi:hypothetical protein
VSDDDLEDEETAGRISMSRTKTVDDNPAISCTVEQLAFAAWQQAVGAPSLAETGPSWERFSTWWRKNATRYSTIRDVCAMAWAESSARALEEWWRDVVARQPRRV